jgi:hypothetical protein
MNKKLVAAVGVVGLTIYLAEPYLSAADNPHTRTETPEPSTLDVSSPISVSGGQFVDVLYSTPAFLHKNGGQPGQLIGQVRFKSVEEAKNAAIPDGCDFAMITVPGGFHVYSPTLAWEFVQSPTSQHVASNPS